MVIKRIPKPDDSDEEKLVGYEREQRIGILLEMESPSNDALLALHSVSGIDIPGLKIDESFSPVPIKAARRNAAHFEAEGKTSVIIHAFIDDKNKIDQLRKQPGVVDVFIDTPIAPHPCPVENCDCDRETPRGTIDDVVRFLKVDEIWASGYKGRDIVIAVMDCGITAEGRPVKEGETSNRIPRVIGGWPDDWGTTSKDWGEHGNMCATDALGMAPEVQLNDIRVSAPNVQSTINNAIQGLQWAMNQHRLNNTPHIITSSWGIWRENWDMVYARDVNHPFTRLVEMALDEGILILFSAGNCGDGCSTGGNKCGPDKGPGKSIWGANGHANVLTVGAVNPKGEYIGYSSQGPAALHREKPDFCSLSHFQGYFTNDNGTSAACPVAAGVVALLKQAYSSLTQDQIQQILKRTANNPVTQPTWDNYFGSGIIQPKLAYDAIRQQK